MSKKNGNSKSLVYDQFCELLVIIYTLFVRMSMVHCISNKYQLLNMNKL